MERDEMGEGLGLGLGLGLGMVGEVLKRGGKEAGDVWGGSSSFYLNSNQTQVPTDDSMPSVLLRFPVYLGIYI